MKTRTKALATASAAALLLATPGLAAAGPRHSDRGDLIAGTFVRTVGLEELRDGLAEEGFDNATVRYTVDLYRLEYATVDAEGEPTTASGLLALPHNRDRKLTAVSFTHGTESTKVGVPSLPGDVWDQAPSWTYASAGFAAVAPDYLGLGTGPGLHPWMDLPSATTASMDMLRAADEKVADLGRRLDRDVMVTGFSQGASAALGLARVLDEGRDDAGRHRFELGAVAAISGAYHLGGEEIPALLAGDLHPKLSVIYTAYLLVSWDRLHDLYDSTFDVFEKDYAPTVEGLFDGYTSGEDLFNGLPNSVDELLTDEGAALLENPRGEFADALAAADAQCADWRPKAPVRLYVTPTDLEAAPSNTEACRADFADERKKVTVVNVGDTDHTDSNKLGTADAVRWFLALS
ncbi:lipase [Phytomonospora sp. NPDC050363]|uniref:alpha/beta hydrolase family protein n=1 Tax=Phytomonospora sp. NPDC050363 TaxID=3155642 RepID=UPI0033FAFE87